MAITRMFTGSAAVLDLHLPIGQARVTVDRAAAEITVVLSTPDDDGPAVEAITGATERLGGDSYQIRVPQNTAAAVVATGGAVIASGNIAGGGVFISQSIGTLHGESSLIVINGNRVQVGAINGPVVSAGIVADVTLPEGVALDYNSLSAPLTVAGHLVALDAETVSGSICLDSIGVVAVKTTSGRVTASTVYGPIGVNTVSGRVEIDSYRGSDAQISTVSGRVAVDAYPGSRGVLRVGTVSGRIELRGTSALTVRASTVSGRKTIS